MKYELTRDIKSLLNPVPDFNFGFQQIDPLELATNLIETLYANGGIGLAANQCGLPYRVFVMGGSPSDIVCFNPTIVYTSNETDLYKESCLSFPGLSIELERPKNIRIRFTTPDGQRHTTRFDGMTARIALHEVMHLNGKYFFEGISKMKMRMALKKAKKLGYDYEGLGLLAHCS